MSGADNAVLALSRSLYGKHITKAQYDELLSMKSFSEIASYLKANTPYCGVLEKAAVTQWTSKSLCEALEGYFFTCLGKICRFEIAAGQQIYKYFLCKNEIDQILECTVHILGGSKDAYLKGVSSFIDRYLSIDLFSLAKANTLEEVSHCLYKTPYKAVFDSCMLESKATYLTYEKAFEVYLQGYQKRLVEKDFSGKARQEIFATLSRQYDVKLIETLTRVIRFHSHSRDILKQIFISDITLFTDKQIKSLLSCKSLAELDVVLAKTPYKELSHLSQSDDITAFIGLYLFSFYKKQLRFSQNPCVVMFSFLSLCRQERANLIKIIQGMKYEMPEEEIRKSLCICET